MFIVSIKFLFTFIKDLFQCCLRQRNHSVLRKYCWSVTLQKMRPQYGRVTEDAKRDYSPGNSMALFSPWTFPPIREPFCEQFVTMRNAIVGKPPAKWYFSRHISLPIGPAGRLLSERATLLSILRHYSSEISYEC
jgi:hypothetical protein